MAFLRQASGAPKCLHMLCGAFLVRHSSSIFTSGAGNSFLRVCRRGWVRYWLVGGMISPPSILCEFGVQLQICINSIVEVYAFVRGMG